MCELLLILLPPIVLYLLWVVRQTDKHVAELVDIVKKLEGKE